MAKTEELPGVEGEGVSTKKIAALEKAIGDWRDIVARRTELTAEEVEASNKVTALMHKHNLTAYPYWVDDDTRKLVVLEGKEKLKLKKAEETETSPENEEDAD